MSKVDRVKDYIKRSGYSTFRAKSIWRNLNAGGIVQEFSRSTVNRAIAELARNGYLEKALDGRNAYWKVAREGAQQQEWV